MLIKLIISSLVVLYCIQACFGVQIISRSEWGAKPPKTPRRSPGEKQFVIIHHSDHPNTCTTLDKCKTYLRNMQADHQNNRKWSDIGYNFAIGGDGLVYEGRGFGVQGSHAPDFNRKSIGIVFIGDYQNKMPTENMLATSKELINYAITKGHLKSDYTLYGHRQVKSTDCPGNYLFNEIKTWPHWKTR